MPPPLRVQENQTEVTPFITQKHREHLCSSRTPPSYFLTAEETSLSGSARLDYSNLLSSPVSEVFVSTLPQKTLASESFGVLTLTIPHLCGAWHNGAQPLAFQLGHNRVSISGVHTGCDESPWDHKF